MFALLVNVVLDGTTRVSCGGEKTSLDHMKVHFVQTVQYTIPSQKMWEISKLSRADPKMDGGIERLL
jgi:hypothetical protein